jgi:metal-sulfur cluster biosynthetic enzyme
MTPGTANRTLSGLHVLVLETEIRSRINLIGDPCSVAHGTPTGLDDMGLVERVDIDPDGDVTVHLRLTSPSCYQIGYFANEIKKLVGEVSGVRSVEVQCDMGLDWSPSMMSDDARARRRETLAAKGLRPLLGE